MRNIPTIEQLTTRLSNAFFGAFNLPQDSDSKILKIFSTVLSGELKLLYLYLVDIQKNLYPNTADYSQNGGELERLGMIYLNRKPRSATSGIYRLRCQGTEGATLRSSLTFKSNENSKFPDKIASLDFEYVLASDSDLITVRTIETGLDNMFEIGDEFIVTEPIIGVDSLFILEQIIENPLSQETEEEYRQSIIESIQMEPQGGSRSDYILWSKDAQGVKKVYPFLKENNAGTIQIYVEAKTQDSIDQLGTPTEQILTKVEEVCLMSPDITKPLYERGRAPIQANLEVLPIIPIPVDVYIYGLQNSQTTVRESIESNLKVFLSEIRPYIAGADLPKNKKDILVSARIGGVVFDTIDNSNYFQQVVTRVDGQIIEQYVFNRSNIPYLRNLIFT